MGFGAYLLLTLWSVFFMVIVLWKLNVGNVKKDIRKTIDDHVNANLGQYVTAAMQNRAEQFCIEIGKSPGNRTYLTWQNREEVENLEKEA